MRDADPNADKDIDERTYRNIAAFSELHKWPSVTPRWGGWLPEMVESEEARMNSDLQQDILARAALRWSAFTVANDLCDQELAKKPSVRFRRDHPGDLFREVWQFTGRPYIVTGLVGDDPDNDRLPEDVIDDGPIGDSPEEALAKETRHQARVTQWHGWLDDFSEGWWSWFMSFYQWKLQAATWAHWCPWGSSSLRGWPYIPDGSIPLYRWMPQTWDPGMETHPKNSPEEVFQRLTGLPICRVPSSASWMKIMLDAENPLLGDDTARDRKTSADRLEAAIATVKQGIAADDRAAARRLNASARRRARIIQMKQPGVVKLTPGLNVAAWPILPSYEID